jgi:hypothetical protein
MDKESKIMAISGVCSNTNAYQSTVQSTYKQRKEDWQNLASALQADDVTGAQNAYAALQKLQPGRSSASGSQGHPATNPIRADFTALGQALQSGDLSSAQSAFATLQKDVQSLQQGQGDPQVRGHHHPHHRGGSTPRGDRESRQSQPQQRRECHQQHRHHD